MHHEDIKNIRIYYETMDGVEWAYTFWGIIKISILKEHYSEEELKQKFYDRITTDPYYDITMYAVNNPLYKKSEEI